LQQDLTNACKTIVSHEDAFIDLAFGMGEIEGLTAQEVKDYIRYIGDRRLTQLNLEPVFASPKTRCRGWMRC